MLDSLRFTNDVRHILGLRLAATSTVLPDADAEAPKHSRKQSRFTATSMAGKDDRLER